jgi:hypothetical protein
LAHAEGSGADFVHPLYAVYQPTGLAYVTGPPSSGQSYDEHFVAPSSWLLRRTALLECGGWRDPQTLSLPVDFDLLRRLAQAGKRMEFCPQLSLLKFPSPLWKIYAWQGIPPQHEYLQKLLYSTEELYQQCLFDIALYGAVQHAYRPSLRILIGMLVRSIKEKLFKLYGEDRPPLYQFRVWRFQKWRRASRKNRGLS